MTLFHASTLLFIGLLVGLISSSPLPSQDSLAAPEVPGAISQPDFTSHSLLDLFCENLPEGNHAIGCASEFVACVDGLGTLMFCPPELVYEPSLDQCLPSKSALVCGGALPLQTSTVVVEETTPIVANDEPVVTTMPPAFSCEFLRDGMYDIGCSTDFIACVGGSSIAMRCPANLKFDVISQKCLADGDVPACTPTLSTAMTTEAMIPTSAEEEQGSGSGSGYDEMEAESTPFADEELESTTIDMETTFPTLCKVDDGAYSLGCSSQFISCIEGKAVFSECPSKELKFDESTHQCLPEEFVPMCDGQPFPMHATQQPIEETTLEEVLSDSTMAMPSEEPSTTESSMKMPPVVFSCLGLPDGVYGQGCSNVFVTCLSDSTLLLHCPVHQKFDTIKGLCAAPEHVPACASWVWHSSPATAALEPETSPLPMSDIPSTDHSGMATADVGDSLRMTN